jgi:hypothetical protein
MAPKSVPRRLAPKSAPRRASPASPTQSGPLLPSELVADILSRNRTIHTPGQLARRRALPQAAVIDPHGLGIEIAQPQPLQAITYNRFVYKGIPWKFTFWASGDRLSLITNAGVLAIMFDRLNYHSITINEETFRNSEEKLVMMDTFIASMRRLNPGILNFRDFLVRYRNTLSLRDYMAGLTDKVRKMGRSTDAATTMKTVDGAMAALFDAGHVSGWIHFEVDGSAGYTANYEARDDAWTLDVRKAGVRLQHRGCERAHATARSNTIWVEDANANAEDMLVEMQTVILAMDRLFPVNGSKQFVESTRVLPLHAYMAALTDEVRGIVRHDGI